MASRRHSRFSKQASLTPEERRKLQDDRARAWQKRIKAAEAAIEDNIHERYASFECEKAVTLESLIQSKDEKAHYANLPTTHQHLITLLECAQHYDTPKSCRPETERYLESLRGLKYKSPSPNISDERYTAIRIAIKKARIESDECPDGGATYQDVEEWMRALYPGIPDQDISATLTRAGALNEPERIEFGGPLVRWSSPNGGGVLFLTYRGRRFLERHEGPEETAREPQLEAVVKAEPPVATAEKRVPKRPPDEAWEVWILFGLRGNQTRVAEEFYCDPEKQYKVSRHISDVTAYLKAGGVAPELTGLQHKAAKPISLDPDLLDMGKRQDGLTPRQRAKRDPDADSG